jgi:DNA-binding transcriptional regulator YdaS (Cro superfamily)
MKLIQYMRAKNLDDAAMAALVGDISEHGIKKIKYGERNPSFAVALRIEAVTKGKVRVADLGKQPAEATP